MAKRVVKGKAFNVAPGIVYFKGKNPNKTDDIDIGPNNPEEGISVDNGEFGKGLIASADGKKVTPISNNIQILSNQPMFNGKSPAQLLYGGMPFNTLFAMQEQYKDIHGINDDGSRQNAQFGILKKIKQSINKHNNDKRQTPLKGIDWSGIKTTNDRAYNQEYINYINDSLVNYGYNNNQRAAILANIIEESGGNPFAEGPGGYYGLLQWGSDRYTKTKEKDVYKEIDNQLKYLHGTIGETKDKKSWTHGGKGSGYNSFTDAMAAYNSDDLNKVMHGFTWGYVRPAGKQNSYLNRQKVADQLINLEGFKYGGIYIKPSKRGTFTAAAKQHGMGVQEFASKVLANKENYSPAMVKKANFARNASKWNHLYGGESILINPLGERPNAKYEIEMSNPVKKANKYYERKLKEENPKMSFPEKVQKIHNEYKELMSPSSIEDIEKMFKRIYKGEPKRGLKKRLERGLYNKYKLENINPQIDSSYLFNQYTINNNNSENKRNKAALGRQQFSISGLPAFDFTIPNTFGNYSLNKPFYPTYVDGPLIGLRVPQSTLNVPAFPTNFTPKSTVGQIDPFIGTKPAFGTSTTGTQKTNSVEGLTKGNGPSTNEMSLYGAIGNTVGALIGAGIQQYGINNLEAPKRQYTLLNPVKLKTKININPQIARMREMQAQLADAARRTSGSSRTAYQKMLAGHNRLLDSAMDLYGRKENAETELINRDRLNQMQVAHTNATNVINAINQTNELDVNNRNYQRVATSNNWTTGLNTTAGAWAGPNGFIDRANALRVKAGELYTQAIANPTAARLLYGDIDFTTGANKRKAFNTIYDFLNNNRFA